MRNAAKRAVSSIAINVVHGRTPLKHHSGFMFFGNPMASPTLRTPLMLSAVAILGACGQSPDSIDSILSVSLDEKPIASLNISLRCSYAWSSFSEMDMASHYEAKAEPARAPTVFATLPDRRLLALSPAPWPPVDRTGRCNPSAIQGWQALVFDPHKPVALLTRISSPDESAGSLAGLALQVKTGSGAMTAAQAASLALKQTIQKAVEKATSLDFVVVDVPRDDDTTMPAENATPLSAETVAALRALPTGSPSVLLPAIRVNAPMNADEPGTDSTLVGLPAFDVAKFMGSSALATYPSMPGLPITLDPLRPIGEGKVYFPGDVPTPAVTLPGLENPLPIAPVAAVWYPDFRKLIVIRWTKRIGELAKLIN